MNVEDVDIAGETVVEDKVVVGEIDAHAHGEVRHWHTAPGGAKSDRRRLKLRHRVPRRKEQVRFVEILEVREIRPENAADLLAEVADGDEVCRKGRDTPSAARASGELRRAGVHPRNSDAVLCEKFCVFKIPAPGNRAAGLLLRPVPGETLARLRDAGRTQQPREMGRVVGL